MYIMQHILYNDLNSVKLVACWHLHLVVLKTNICILNLINPYFDRTDIDSRVVHVLVELRRWDK